MDDDTARWAGLAREIARMPQVVERLRAEHVEGPDGRCVACPSALWVAPRWPCRLRLLADRAAELRRDDADVPAADVAPPQVVLRNAPCRTGGLRRS